MGLKINNYGNLVWANEKREHHREKGPAFICTDGHISYAFNGITHRLDGPAIIGSSGSKSYFIHGKEYTKEEYYAKVKEL